MSRPPKDQNPQRPSYKLYRVINGRTKADKSLWTVVAACWPHADGGGFNIKFRFNEAAISGATYVMRREAPSAQADC